MAVAGDVFDAAQAAILAIVDSHAEIQRRPSRFTPIAWSAPSLHVHLLTWQCTYNNTGSNVSSTVVAGPNRLRLPATAPKFGYVSGGNCYSL